jgi:hypothetical protein
MSSDSDKIDQVVSGLQEINATANHLNRFRHTLKKRQDAKESGELKRLTDETRRYNDKSFALTIGCWIIWATMIIATIILCVTNNDVVLTALHI